MALLDTLSSIAEINNAANAQRQANQKFALESENMVADTEYKKARTKASDYEIEQIQANVALAQNEALNKAATELKTSRKTGAISEDVFKLQMQSISDRQAEIMKKVPWLPPINPVADINVIPWDDPEKLKGLMSVVIPAITRMRMTGDQSMGKTSEEQAINTIVNTMNVSPDAAKQLYYASNMNSLIESKSALYTNVTKFLTSEFSPTDPKMREQAVDAMIDSFAQVDPAILEEKDLIVSMHNLAKAVNPNDQKIALAKFEDQLLRSRVDQELKTRFTYTTKENEQKFLQEKELLKMKINSDITVAGIHAAVARASGGGGGSNDYMTRTQIETQLNKAETDIRSGMDTIYKLTTEAAGGNPKGLYMNAIDRVWDGVTKKIAFTGGNDTMIEGARQVAQFMKDIGYSGGDVTGGTRSGKTGFQWTGLTPKARYYIGKTLQAAAGSSDRTRYENYKAGVYAGLQAYGANHVTYQDLGLWAVKPNKSTSVLPPKKVVAPKTGSGGSH